MDTKLVMFRQSGDRRDFPIRSGGITIGRKDDCDIRIPLAEVSRHHAKLTVTDEGVVVQDLGSANGTYVNNKRVKKQTLAAGDHVVVGPVVFTLQIDGEPENIRAVKTKLRPLSSVSPASSSAKKEVAASDHVYDQSEEVDPISALEALASSADQTAIDPFEDEDQII